jgi:hypothetical protein
MYSNADEKKVIEDPGYREISKAIRNYLRHEYANVKHGILNDAPPMKLSTYSGKGVGHYQTAPDGRADWSPELERFIERSEARKVTNPEHKFGFHEVDLAMARLRAQHERWYDVLMDVEVQGMSVDDLAERVKKDPSTIKRYRIAGTMFLYRELIAHPGHARKLKVKIIRVV